MIIPIFIMNRGCPHRCTFCNVRLTAGTHRERLSEAEFRDTVQRHFESIKRQTDHIQIAFFGGNFTGMNKNDQIDLLRLAEPFIKQGLVNSVRISTRPDYIEPECLERLKAFNVTTVEIGAQSMVDNVLNLANRGHSAADVTKAMRMLTEGGFETVVHLMAGLPGDNPSHFKDTVEKIISLKPNMVRIHPTIVFADTHLEKDYLNGNYVPLSLTEAIEICKCALIKFEEAHIPVIRLGLQTTREMETPGSIIAGPYHPAFRSLVEESFFYDMAFSLLQAERPQNKGVTFIVSPKDVSSFRGQKNRNLKKIKAYFDLADIKVLSDPHQPRRSLNIKSDNKVF